MPIFFYQIYPIAAYFMVAKGIQMWKFCQEEEANAKVNNFCFQNSILIPNIATLMTLSMKYDTNRVYESSANELQSEKARETMI